MDVRRRVAISECPELLDRDFQVRPDVTQKRPGPLRTVSRHELLLGRLKPWAVRALVIFTPSSLSNKMLESTSAGSAV